MRFTRLAMVSILFPVLGYTQAVTIGAGYRAPQPVEVAPGQVITLFVRVPGKIAADPVTAQLPLPTALGGFSVVLRQSFPSEPLAVPIFAVEDSRSCSQLTPEQCEVVSMITVQIPYQLTPNVPRALIPMNYARLDVSFNDTPATPLLLSAVPDRIHVLNSCDVNSGLPAGTCVPVVRHADGNLVNLMRPAQPGETLIMSVVGLGYPNQAVATGAAAPQPAVAVNDVWIGFDARVNQGPGMPLGDPAPPPATARLRPGAVGIYDITFNVPDLPAGIPACSNTVRSNLTVSIGRTVSMDGAGICVAPAGGAQQQDEQ
jgi:uncharacterized protein (TIGR03437 family)